MVRRTRLTPSFAGVHDSKEAKSADDIAKCETLERPTGPLYFSLMMPYSRQTSGFRGALFSARRPAKVLRHRHRHIRWLESACRASPTGRTLIISAALFISRPARGHR